MVYLVSAVMLRGWLQPLRLFCVRWIADIAVPAHPHYGATFQSGRFASESRAYWHGKIPSAVKSSGSPR